MFKTLNIDGKEIEFSANAATPFRYRQIFHKDLLSILGNEEKHRTKVWKRSQSWHSSWQNRLKKPTWGS